MVRGKQKTNESGWIAGVGPFEKKKDFATYAFLLASTQSSHVDILRQELAEVRLQLADIQGQLQDSQAYKQFYALNYDDLMEFFSSCFSDFLAQQRYRGRIDGANGSGSDIGTGIGLPSTQENQAPPDLSDDQ